MCVCVCGGCVCVYICLWTKNVLNVLRFGSKIEFVVKKVHKHTI